MNLITIITYISILIALTCCDPVSDGSFSGGVPDTTGFSRRATNQMNSFDLAGAINTVMLGPSRCGNDSVRQASSWANWRKFSSQSTRAGNNFDGPFGRVEFYNGSHLALPGERGITAVGKSRHLSNSILDIVPLVAMAHKKYGHAMRVSHSTSGRHSSNSLHYAGRAIDIDPSPARDKRKIALEVRNMLAASGRGCGYLIIVESSHIHISFKGSGNAGCPGYLED